MKQLVIYCSEDLEHQVVSSLDRHGAEGYLKIPRAVGHKFLEAATLPRTVSFEAIVLVVPGAAEATVAAVLEDLQDYAGKCEIQPCLRASVVNVEQLV
jgi:hypothetical protein